MAHVPRHRVPRRPAGHVRLRIDRHLLQARRRCLVEAWEHGAGRGPFPVLELDLGDLVGALVDAAVGTPVPGGRGSPGLLDARDATGGKVGRPHVFDGILHGALRFRIALAADPGPEVLLGQEVLERGRPGHLAVDLVGDEHAVLVDDQRPGPPAHLAGEAVDRAAGLLGVEPVVLGADPQVARVPQQDAREVDDKALLAPLLAEVHPGPLACGRRARGVVASARICALRHGALVLEPVDEVAQRLPVAGEPVAIALVDEPLREHVAGRAHLAARVLRHDLDDRAPERLCIERHPPARLGVVVFGRGLHVVVLAHRLDVGGFPVLFPEPVVGLLEAEARQPRLLHLVDHLVPYHLVCLLAMSWSDSR